MTNAAVRKARVAALLAAACTAVVLAGPALAQGAETVLFGTVRFQGEPLSNVRVVAELQDGDFTGEDLTNDQGRWEIEVPQGGTYVVSLVQDTLREGLSVRDPDRFAQQEVTVETGGRRAVLFPVTEEEAAGPGGAFGEQFGRVASNLVIGLQLGAIIAITSIGLSLIFGVTGLVNFAHGEMVTFGALVALTLNEVPGINLHLITAGMFGIVAGAALGFALEGAVFGPLRNRGTSLIALLVISIGASIVLRYFFLMTYTGQKFPYSDYTLASPLEIGPVTTSWRDIVVTLIALGVLLAVGLLLTRTKLGTAMRAVADNADLAESSGINVQWIILATWIGGGALAALGGILQGTVQGVQFDMGFRLLLLMFAAIILGGLGTAFGAMVGGILIGIIAQLTVLVVGAEMKLVVPFGVLIAMLLVRPQGLLGRRERIG